MSSMQPEEQVAFLLCVLKNTKENPGFDFEQVYQEHNLKNKKNARYAFKSVVEANGKYLLTSDNRVVLKDDSDETEDEVEAPAAPKKRGRPKKIAEDATTAAKNKRNKKDGNGDAAGGTTGATVAIA